MKTIKFFLLVFLLLFISKKSFAQLGISATNTPPNSKAMLDVSSTDNGLLIPRMTSVQRTGIASPPQVLSVFDTQTKSFWYFDGLIWKEMNSNAVSSLPYYPAVTICCQSWMNKNLEVTNYRNGDPILQVTDPTAWSNLTTGAWCYYANNLANGPIYGKLYNWYAVNDPRGLAPEGWHIPTDFEVATLNNCLGASAGGLMKQLGTTLWTTPNDGATNGSGFNGVPSGYRSNTGVFSSLGTYAYFYTATPNTPTLADIACFGLYFNWAFTITAVYSPKHGLSVRCIRD
jgi:uncharacterized protein (TIGR02145 family)